MGELNSVNNDFQIGESLLCYHCGDTCKDNLIYAHDKNFCCEGCKLVYEILEENNLGNYYNLNKAPGIRDQKNRQKSKFDYLDNENIRNRLISFSNAEVTHITFLIPQIHCSSCIWLLEHLYKIHCGIKNTVVNFLKREATIVFSEKEISLKEVVALLDQIGYRPHISLGNVESPKTNSSRNKVYYRLGVAFFCFGNIMLLSFPEYFGLNEIVDKGFKSIFGYLNIILSLPVLFFSASGFFRSAYNGLQQKRLNMDFPISLGIVAMYVRSLIEILSSSGPGYMDTFSGLVFFMLAGRLFQDKSYERLSFERDYKSYFPLSVTVSENGREYSKAVNEVNKGERLIIHNEELVPVDSILVKGNANIDYSFVTGESKPVPISKGEVIYAGGKQLGTVVELEAINKISQSRLTQLWNDENYKNLSDKNHSRMVDTVSKYFTIGVVLLAIGSGVFYILNDQIQTAFNSFSAILIITCPCALALSYPFALGNSIRILGRNKFYLKNAGVVEHISEITDVVFDKTGTLTHNGTSGISYTGENLSEMDKSALFSIFSQSSHPISKSLSGFLNCSSRDELSGFGEFPGCGVEGVVNQVFYQAGSLEFAGESNNSKVVDKGNLVSTRVYISINKEFKGYFSITNNYRDNLSAILQSLKVHYFLHLLSGDNSAEKKNLLRYFENENSLLFNQSPEDKLKYVKELQSKNSKVMMIGDGLNDAGALKQSNCGIAISDDVNNFSPSSDAILHASAFRKLPAFMRFSKTSIRTIYGSYVISLLYNTIGIWFAIQGNLSPLIAAIIMPLSTVSIVIFTTSVTSLAAIYHKVNR